MPRKKLEYYLYPIGRANKKACSLFMERFIKLRKNDISVIVKNCFHISEKKEIYFYTFFPKKYIIKSNVFYEKDGYYYLRDDIIKKIYEMADFIKIY